AKYGHGAVIALASVGLAQPREPEPPGLDPMLGAVRARAEPRREPVVRNALDRDGGPVHAEGIKATGMPNMTARTSEVSASTGRPLCPRADITSTPQTVTISEPLCE